jgi:hypothetical protein
VEIQRASNLGVSHQQLGIEPNTRICLTFIKGGFTVWDVENEMEYTVTADGRIAKFPKPLEPSFQRIFTASDDELKLRYSSSILAAGADFGAASYRVPRGICPFNCTFIAHFEPPLHRPRSSRFPHPSSGQTRP